MTNCHRSFLTYLHFLEGPSNEPPVTTTLRLTNTSRALDVLFRVQTTSPTVYRVRPSHGRIPANSHLDVQVVMVSDPVKADKFLVKWVTVAHSLPHGDFAKQFQEAEGSARERRLRVNITGASGANGNERAPAAVVTQGGDSTPTSKGASTASLASLASLPSMSQETLIAELKEARARIQALSTQNQELSRSLEETKRRRPERDEVEHAATKIPRGISEAELDSLIRAQSGFPPVLVILISIFSFLVGLLF